jgi:hypothetical protein
LFYLAAFFKEKSLGLNRPVQGCLKPAKEARRVDCVRISKKFILRRDKNGISKT